MPVVNLNEVRMYLGVDILKHIFAVCVIIQHMSSKSRYSFETNNALAAFVDWIDGAVLGFMFLSGFLAKKQDSISSYVMRCGARLLAPYLIFSILYAVVMAALKKGDVIEGVVKTLTFQGSSMQLYYIPYALAISLAFAVGAKCASGLIEGNGKIILLAFFCSISQLMKTESSTGSDLRLIPLYCFAYVFGALVSEHMKIGNFKIIATVAVFGFCIVGIFDHRYYDLLAVLILFCVFDLLSLWLPKMRFPGSGATFLLHTPIVNFSISTILLRVQVVQGANIVLSVLLTYISCLAVCFLVIRFAPRFRWLILE